MPAPFWVQVKTDDATLHRLLRETWKATGAAPLVKPDTIRVFSYNVCWENTMNVKSTETRGTGLATDCRENTCRNNVVTAVKAALDAGHHVVALQEAALVQPADYTESMETEYAELIPKGMRKLLNVPSHFTIKATIATFDISVLIYDNRVFGPEATEVFCFSMKDKKNKNNSRAAVLAVFDDYVLGSIHDGHRMKFNADFQNVLSERGAWKESVWKDKRVILAGDYNDETIQPLSLPGGRELPGKIHPPYQTCCSMTGDFKVKYDHVRTTGTVQYLDKENMFAAGFILEPSSDHLPISATVAFPESSQSKVGRGVVSTQRLIQTT